MEHTLYYRYVRRSLLTMLNLFLSTSLRKILSSPGVFLLLLFSRISIFHGYSYYSYIFIAAYTGKLTLPTTHIYISKSDHPFQVQLVQFPSWLQEARHALAPFFSLSGSSYYAYTQPGLIFCSV